MRQRTWSGYIGHVVFIGLVLLVGPTWAVGQEAPTEPCAGKYKGKELTPEELTTVLAKHKAWLEEVGYNNDAPDERRANLCEAHLQKADLQEANLYRANLQEAHLSSANLQKADLSGANLRRPTWAEPISRRPTCSAPISRRPSCATLISRRPTCSAPISRRPTCPAPISRRPIFSLLLTLSRWFPRLLWLRVFQKSSFLFLLLRSSYEKRSKKPGYAAHSAN